MNDVIFHLIYKYILSCGIRSYFVPFLQQREDFFLKQVAADDAVMGCVGILETLAVVAVNLAGVEHTLYCRLVLFKPVRTDRLV